MGIVIEARGPRDATASEYRNKSIPLNDTMGTLKREFTCGEAAQTETDQLLPLLRRASAMITIVRDRRSSTSAAKNSLTLRLPGKL